MNLPQFVNVRVGARRQARGTVFIDRPTGSSHLVVQADELAATIEAPGLDRLAS